MSATSITPAESGGLGGRRDRRLLRMVQVANLKAARLMPRSLDVLGGGLEDENPRERRLAAEALVRHYRETTKPAAVQAVQVNVADGAADVVLDLAPLLPTTTLKQEEARVEDLKPMRRPGDPSAGIAPANRPSA